VALLLLIAAVVAGFAADKPAASGLALLGIATAPALFAVPPRGRPLLGLAIAGVAVLAGIAGGLGGDVLAWGSLAALVLAGLVIAWWGRRWPALSGRFSSRPAAGAPDPGSLWRELDRGHDPTDPADPAEPTGTTESDSELDQPPDPPRV
jgi:hypothetical protein